MIKTYKVEFTCNKTSRKIVDKIPDNTHRRVDKIKGKKRWFGTLF